MSKRRSISTVHQVFQFYPGKGTALARSHAEATNAHGLPVGNISAADFITDLHCSNLTAIGLIACGGRLKSKVNALVTRAQR